MKQNEKGIGTLQGVIVAIVVIAIVVGVGAWYFMGGEEEPTNGGPTNGDGNGNGNGNGGPGPAPEKIKIGMPVPLSGAISAFGEAEPWAAEKMMEEVNKDGGIYLEKYDKRVPVEILIRDTESSPKTAASVAEVLITKDDVDLMVTLHTPDTTVPVCGISEKHGVPTISSDTPQESWLSGAPYKWSYNAFWTVSDIGEVLMNQFDMRREQTSEVVGALWPDGPDGRAFKEVHKPMWEEAGYEVVFTGYFPKNLDDFSSIINTFKEKNVDIIAGVVPPPAFHRFMRQCVEMEFHPQLVTTTKSGMFPSAMEALGELSDGVCCINWWSPYHPYTSSVTGMTAREWADAYTEETGKQWTPPIGYGEACLEIAFDAIERAGNLEPESLRQAIANTELDTIVGPIDFKNSPPEDEIDSDVIAQNKEHISVTPLVGGQWFPSEEWTWKIEIINNGRWDEIPETSGMVFPKPWPS